MAESAVEAHGRKGGGVSWRRRLVLWLTFLVASLARAAAAGSMPMDSIQTVSAPIYQLNSEGVWRPTTQPAALQAGGSLLVSIPDAEPWLTVAADPAHLARLQVSFSQDGFLFREILPLHGLDPERWFFDTGGAGLLRLQVRPGAEDVAGVRVWRRQPWPEPALWPPRDLPHNGVSAMVRIGDRRERRGYLHLAPGRPVLVGDPGGDGSVWLEMRALFSAGAEDAGPHSSVRLQVRQDDWTHEVAVMLGQRREIADVVGKPTLVGPRRALVVNLPRADGSWTLLADRPLLVRLAAPAQGLLAAGPRLHPPPVLPHPRFGFPRPPRSVFLPAPYDHPATALFENRAQPPSGGPREAGLVWRESLRRLRDKGRPLLSPKRLDQATDTSVSFVPLPLQARGAMAFRFLSFVPSRKDDPVQPRRRVTTPRLLAQDAPTVHSALFTRIQLDRPLTLNLAAVPVAARLRLRVHSESGAPFRLNVLPAEGAVVRLTGETGAAAFRHASVFPPDWQFDPLTMQAEPRVQAPLVGVGEAVFSVAPECRMVTLSLEQGDAVWVSVAQARGLPYRLDRLRLAEIERAAAQPAHQRLRRLLLGVRNQPSLDQAGWALHHEPLARLMLARHHAFRGDPHCQNASLLHRQPLAGAAARALWDRAETLWQDDFPHEALRLFSELAIRNHWDEARLRRGCLLMEMGELFLAEQDLRGLFFETEDPVVRRDVYHILRLHYRVAGEETNEAALAASMFLRDGDVSYLTTIARDLTQRGLFRRALDVWRMVPDAAPMTLALLESREAELVTIIAPDRLDPVEQGIRAAMRGDGHTAQASWRQAGTSAQPLLEAWRKGRAIATRLNDPSPVVRFQAYLELETWWHNAPGPKAWQSAPDALTKAAATVRVVQTALDLGSTFAKTTADVPGEWAFTGPGTVRLEMRPLHQPGEGGGLVQGVLTLEKNGLPYREQYRDNPVSENLQMEGVTSPWVGGLIQRDFELGPGLHRFRVWGDRPLLVAARVQQPIGVMPDLPRPSPSLLRRVLDGPPEVPAFPATDLVLVDDGGNRRDCVSCDLVSETRVQFQAPELERRAWLGRVAHQILGPVSTYRTCVPEPRPRLPETLYRETHFDDATKARIALRLDDHTGVDTESGWSRLKHPEERRTLLEQLVARKPETFAPELAELTHDDRRAWLTAAGDYQGAVAVPVDNEAAAIRALSLLPATVTGSEPDLAVFRRARQLVSAFPANSTVRRLAAPLLRPFTWETVGFFDEGQEVQPLEVTGISPSQWVRLAMLTSDPESFFLLGRQRKMVVFAHEEPRPLELALALERPVPLRSVPVDVQFQWDDASPLVHRMFPTDSRQIISLVPPHEAKHLTIGMVNPPANQVLRVRVREQREGAYRPLEGPAPKRLYRVVHAEQPLSVTFHEPTLVRVETRLREGVRFEELALEQPPFRFKRESNQEPQLLRLERLVPRFHPVPEPRPVPAKPWRAEAYSMAVAPGPEPARTHPLLNAPAPALARWAGYWEAAFVQRELSDDDDAEDAGRDRFFQVGYSLRRRWGTWGLFSRSRAALRLREEVGHSLDLSHTFLLRRPRFDLTLQIGATVQFLDSVVLPGQVPVRREFDDPYATRTLLSWHTRWFHVDRWSARTQVTGFYRYLGFDVLPPGPLDWDVATNYRINHQHGLRVGQLLRYQPTLDGRLDLQASLTTNERLDESPVDFYRFGASWVQALGRWEGSLGLQFRYFDADQHRAASISQWLPGLTLGRWSGDLRGHHQFTGLRFTFDPDNQATNISVSWRYNHRGSAGLDDYLPRELRFPQLMQRR